MYVRFFIVIKSNISVGGPVILTLPHMLGAAPEYQTVDGIHPDVEKHQTFVDVEPVSKHLLIIIEIFTI